MNWCHCFDAPVSERLVPHNKEHYTELAQEACLLRYNQCFNERHVQHCSQAFRSLRYPYKCSATTSPRPPSQIFPLLAESHTSSSNGNGTEQPISCSPTLDVNPKTPRGVPRGFYVDSRRPSLDTYPSQPSPAATPPAPFNHSILQNLPTVALPPLSWNPWKEPHPLQETSRHYASTARPTIAPSKLRVLR